MIDAKTARENLSEVYPQEKTALFNTIQDACMKCKCAVDYVVENEAHGEKLKAYLTELGYTVKFKPGFNAGPGFETNARNNYKPTINISW